MSPVALIARTGPLLALLAVWLQVLGGGVLPALEAGRVMVAPLCHAMDGRTKPVLPAHGADCDSCVLCNAPAGADLAGGVVCPPPLARVDGGSLVRGRGIVLAHRQDPGHRPRGPPAPLS